MSDRLTAGLNFFGDALTLRAERQRVIASNIANADTPGYAARDFDFARTLAEARGATSAAPGALGGTGLRSAAGLQATHARHLGVSAAAAAPTPRMLYETPSQPSADGNSVELDRERAKFADNAIRYEATLRFVNGHVKTLLSAIQGQ